MYILVYIENTFIYKNLYYYYRNYMKYEQKKKEN